MEVGISKVIWFEEEIVNVSFNLVHEALMHGVISLNSSTDSDRGKSFFMASPV